MLVKRFLEVGWVGYLSQLVEPDFVDDWLGSYDPGSRTVLRGLVKRFLMFGGVQTLENKLSPRCLDRERSMKVIGMASCVYILSLLLS